MARRAGQEMRKGASSKTNAARVSARREYHAARPNAQLAIAELARVLSSKAKPEAVAEAAKAASFAVASLWDAARWVAKNP